MLSTSLPNLSRLSLHCAPCGKPFERWDDALLDEESKTHPNYKFWGQDDICGICREPLETKADLGDATYEVEALIEKLTCGHVFHRSCLKESIKNGVRNCPQMDKTPIAQEVLDRLAPGTNAREGEMQRLGVYDSGERGRWYNEIPPEARANDPERQAQLEEAETDVEEEAETDVEEEETSVYFDGNMRMLIPLPELDAFNGFTLTQILSGIADLIRNENELNSSNAAANTRNLLERFLQSYIEDREITTRVTNNLRTLLGAIYRNVTTASDGSTSLRSRNFRVKSLYRRLGPKPYYDDTTVRILITPPRIVRMREIVPWLQTNIYRACIREYDARTYGPLETNMLGSRWSSQPLVLIDNEIKNKFDVAYLLRMHPACTKFAYARLFINDQTVNNEDERLGVMRTWFWLHYRILFDYGIQLSMDSPSLLQFRYEVTRERIARMKSPSYMWGERTTYEQLVSNYMHDQVADFWNTFTRLNTSFEGTILRELGL
jgi:hypothetical protein